MAGHVEDRWYRDKKDDHGKVVLNAKGKPQRERSTLYGKGMRYRVRYYVNGSETSESFPDKQLERAKAFLAKVQVDILTGTYVDPDAGKVSLREYVTKWRKGQTDDPSSRQSIDASFNGMIWPFFGERTLTQVAKVDVVRDWLAWMKDKGSSVTYRAQMFTLMSSVLAAAVHEKLISDNPFVSPAIRRPRPQQRKIAPWSEAKVQGVHSALPDCYKILVPIGIGAGLRQMEIMGFSPDDIDRSTQKLHVNRQIRWIGGVPTFAPPKGGKVRTVPLGDGLLAGIDAYLSAYEPVAVTLPWLEPGGKLVTVRLLINRAGDGLPVKRRLNGKAPAPVWHGSRFLDNVWRPAVQRSGFPYVKREGDGMHALRHFCASNWLANGVSILEVSEYLGHHDPAFTLRIYTHLVPSSHDRTRTASDQVMGLAAWPTANLAETA